jgi:phosphoribosyl 1,2-cyclic phosphate phosphodiesterase
MHLIFLGTAAAEGFPGIFCNCANCRAARARGGRSLRYRSALLVNTDLLIDCGPDLLASAQRFNLNLSQVTTNIVTHAHPDHFHIENFMLRRRAFTGGQEIPMLDLFGPIDVTGALEQAKPDLSTLRLQVHPVSAFQTWSHSGYTFSTFKAHHAIGEYEAIFYSVGDGQHSFLYVTDTGRLPEETWQALAGKSFDAIILEETLGTGSYTQHLGFDTFRETAARMRAGGLLHPGARLIAHHMSHSGNPAHEELEALLAPDGVEVAYDGMEVVL